MIKTDDPPLAPASASYDNGEEVVNGILVSKLRTKSDSRPVSATYAKYEIKGDYQRNASDVHLREGLQESAPFISTKNYSHPNSGVNTPYRPSSPANVKFSDEIDDGSLENGGEVTLESILKSSSILTQLQNQNVRQYNNPDPVNSLPTGTSKMQLMKNLQQLRTYKMGTAPEKKTVIFQKVVEQDGNVEIAFKKRVPSPHDRASSSSGSNMKIVSKPVPTIKDPQEKNMTRPKTAVSLSGIKPHKSNPIHDEDYVIKEIVIRRPRTSSGLTSIPHIIGQDLNLDSISHISHGPLYSPATFRRPAKDSAVVGHTSKLQLPLHTLNLGEVTSSAEQSNAEDSYRDDRREQFLQDSIMMASEDDDKSFDTTSRSPGRLIRKKYHRYAEELVRPTTAPNKMATSTSMPALTEKDIHVAAHSSLGFK